MSEPSIPAVPEPDPSLTRTREASTSKAATLGAYHLLQRIGEGGMGEVWMAEQTTPMRRLVAVKIIKAGMDTARVIARFEAERQALALMDHPAIATVFDGGATAEGRPYFAMEYVKGEPITTYCDRHRLSTTERLGLFTLDARGQAVDNHRAMSISLSAVVIEPPDDVIGPPTHELLGCLALADCMKDDI